MNKLVKIILALAMTAAVMMFAKSNSRGRPDYFLYSENGYTFEMTTVPKGIEFTEETITLTVTPNLPDGSQLVFRRADQGIDKIDDLSSYRSQPMIRSDSVPHQFEITVTAGVKNNRFKYYFEVVDSTHNVLARFIAPADTPFDFRYIGAVPPYILAPHLIFIFATFFAVSMSAMSAIPLLFGSSTDTYPAARWLFWSMLFSFMGCYPFGIPMNWYAFGGGWEGVPFGTDATDNKTQLMFVYLAYAWLAGLGSFLRGRKGRDLYSPRAYGLVTLGGLIVTLAIYAIPHSIQFSPALTYSVCYGFIGLVFLLYVTGYVRTGKHA